MPTQKAITAYFLSISYFFIIFTLNGCTPVPKKNVTTLKTKPTYHLEFKTPENVALNQEPASSSTYLGIGSRSVPKFALDPHAINKPPPGLKQNIAWRPARHFGAWYKGSDFGDINIISNGVGSTWYFNEYYSTMPGNKKRIYKKYHRRNVNDPLDSVTLPSNATADLAHLPAGQPASTMGAHNLLLSLEQIDKTSKYGGTIKLLFKMADVTGPHNDNVHIDDFEYEFVHTDSSDSTAPITTLFNVDDVRLNIYVAPHPDEFNRTNNFENKCQVYAEIDIDGITAVQNGKQIEYQSVQNLLIDQLSTLGLHAANNNGLNNRAPHACALVQGFLHDQFINELGELTATTDKIDKILISDNFIDVFTREGQPVLTADWQITLIRIDTEPGKEETQITGLRVGHEYDGSHTSFDIINSDDPVKLEHMGTSPTYALGNWLVDEICPAATPATQLLEYIDTRVHIRETDSSLLPVVGFDDLLGVTEQKFPAPFCGTIRATISSDQWGLMVDFRDRVDLYHQEYFTPEPSNLYLGFYNYRSAYRLSVR